MPLDSEYELMQRLSAGNEDAFGELFGRYYPRVCAFVGCIVKEESTAEDIAQDIFLKIWERRDIFQGRVASFNGYVYRMARNAALNAIRQMTNIDWEQYIQIEETLPDESFEKEYYSREKELFIRLVVCRLPGTTPPDIRNEPLCGDGQSGHCRRTQDIETNGRKPPDARIEKTTRGIGRFLASFLYALISFAG